LNKLKKEKSDTLCNTFFSAFLAAFGCSVFSSSTSWFYIPSQYNHHIGLLIVAISLLFGYIRPIVSEFIWLLVKFIKTHNKNNN
jgi:hypothetical protein